MVKSYNRIVVHHNIIQVNEEPLEFLAWYEFKKTAKNELSFLAVFLNQVLMFIYEVFPFPVFF